MSSTPDSDSVERRLTQVVEQLQIPNSTLQITQVRLNRLGTEDDIDDDRMDEVAAAALALSSREDGLPVSEREIADGWSDQLASSDVDADVSPDQLRRQIDAVAEYLDLGEPPAHPGDLIREFGEALQMPDRLIEVGQRILHDAFETDPTVVAGGTSPSGTAGAALYLAAEINGAESEFDQDTLGDISDTSAVTVRNRYRELRDLLGDDRLAAARYQLNGDGDAEAVSEADADAVSEAEADQQAATDGNGDTATETETATTDTAGAGEATTDEDTMTASEPDAGQASSDDHAAVVSAVEDEIDALTDDVDASASARLFARGMAGDAVDGVDNVTVEDAPKLAGAAVVAGARMEDSDIDTTDVAGERSFQARAVTKWLDELDTAVDVDIPRRSATDVVEQLVEQLELSEEVREESLLALEQYQSDEDDQEFTAAEMGAGAVFFAATVGRTQVDIDAVSDITGATPEFITDAMNSVVVSLCLGLVRGDIDYDDCSWTTDLLESELSPDIGDSYTGRVIALAKTYAAGREQDHVDAATVDVVLGED
jgi:transcription initiation factor TFIIIB Brf1 subunit/transcription initiation factor TFIIB